MISGIKKGSPDDHRLPSPDLEDTRPAKT